uniref:lysophospholipid acyltransferase family protein n=1 Tax=Eubacterium cellulosolvens TaxID=29322 RepID=UPI0004882ECD|nr:lysophospholipid acyltransferase family protein [[Eubacterium] cellulosolvens]
MFRLIFSVLFAVLYLILGLPVLGVLCLVGKINRNAKDRACQAAVSWAFRVILAISGIRVTVLGKENIPAEQAALYVGNHRSNFDILATYPFMKRPGGYIAKKSMEKIPLLNLWMRAIYCFFLDRSNIKDGMQMIKDAIAQIKDGRNVFVFPEGTRNRGEADTPLLPFHEGSFRIATMTGCPVIPVAINNSVNILEAHSPWIKSTHIVIEFGAPVDTSNLSRDEKKHLGETTRGIITEMLEKNQSLV